MLNVVVIGEYGIRSLGDEAMLHVLARGLHDRFGEITITPISRLAVLPFNGDDYADTMARTANAMTECRDGMFRTFRGDLSQISSVNLMWNKAGDGLVWTVLEQADLILIGGGGLFIDINTSFSLGPSSFFAFAIQAAHVLGKPIVPFSVSLGPLTYNWSHKLVADALAKCAAVIVRDRTSQELARELGCEAVLLPDLAIALDPIGDKELDGDYFAVAPKWLDDEQPGWMDSFIPVVIRIRDETGLAPLLIPQCQFERRPVDNDALVCQHIAGQLNGTPTVVGEGSLVPEIVLGLYRQCQAALTVRLHGAVFAAVSGVPHVALNYWPKVRGFCDWTGSPCLEIDADDIVETFIEMWQRRDEERERLQTRVSELRALIPQYWDVMEEVIA